MTVSDKPNQSSPDGGVQMSPDGKQDPRGTGGDEKHLHWQSPTLMILAFLCGLALALGHHFYYRFWDRRPVASDTQQQWVIRGGNAFAWCVQVLLAASTAIAFVQHVWLSLSRKDHSISSIDSMFDVLGNALEFAHLGLWWKHPILFLAALITWTLPIASVITPGTLVVVTSLESSQDSMVVPQLDFYHNASNYRRSSGGSYGDSDVLGSLAEDVMRIGIASSTSMSTLLMDPPYSNCSYTLAFNAPALKCRPANANEWKTFDTAAGDYIYETMGAVEYFSWVPGGDDSDSIGLPPLNSTDFPALDIVSSSGAQLYLYAANPTSDIYTQSMVQCRLHNGSYTVEFSFENTRDQHMRVKELQFLNPVHADLYTSPVSPRKALNETIAFVSVMEAFGDILTGSYIFYPGTAASLTDTRRTTIFGATALSSIAYSASNATLALAMEDLFRNITFSLFSSQTYLLDRSYAAQLSPTNVTILSSRNVYSYADRSLLLAYGIALLAALICVALGIYAMFSSGMTFNNGFSTVLRTTRGAGIDGVVFAADANGADPVSDTISETRLIFRPHTDGRWPGFATDFGVGRV